MVRKLVNLRRSSSSSDMSSTAKTEAMHGKFTVYLEPGTVSLPR
jgi:hypothetical protein